MDSLPIVARFALLAIALVGFISVSLWFAHRSGQLMRYVDVHHPWIWQVPGISLKNTHYYPSAHGRRTLRLIRLGLSADSGHKDEKLDQMLAGVRTLRLLMYVSLLLLIVSCVLIPNEAVQNLPFFNNY